MRVVWVTRSFLDYRLPVYNEFFKLTNHEFFLVYNSNAVPERVNVKIKNLLGKNAIGLTGEKVIGHKSYLNSLSNKRLRIPYQPGLLKTIRDLQPDILVTDGFFQWTFAALWLRFTKSVPIVMCYERTMHTERNAQKFRTVFRKFVMKYIDAICCSGKLCGEYVKWLGYPEKKITYGHMVADVEYLSQAVAMVSTEESRQFMKEKGITGVIYLYVGILQERKGILQLLNAWYKSGQMKNDEISLVLVGDGPDAEQYKKYCSDNNLNNVYFIGKIDYDQLAVYYKAADIFIIPTLEDNWSLVVPEAMACNLPVITTIYNGCWPELVTPENGWVFDSLNSDAFCQVLKASFESRKDFKKMGEKSREIVAKHGAYQAAKTIFETCKIT